MSLVFERGDIRLPELFPTFNGSWLPKREVDSPSRLTPSGHNSSPPDAVPFLTSSLEMILRFIHSLLSSLI